MVTTLFTPRADTLNISWTNQEYCLRITNGSGVPALYYLFAVRQHRFYQRADFYLLKDSGWTFRRCVCIMRICMNMVIAHRLCSSQLCKPLQSKHRSKKYDKCWCRKYKTQLSLVVSLSTAVMTFIHSVHAQSRWTVSMCFVLTLQARWVSATWTHQSRDIWRVSEIQAPCWNVHNVSECRDRDLSSVGEDCWMLDEWNIFVSSL